MKNFLMGLRGGFIVCAALCWWGFLYPELAMVPDTYHIVNEKEANEWLESAFTEEGTIQNASKVVKWDFDSDIYRRILETDRSKIRFSSKLLQSVTELMENLKE